MYAKTSIQFDCNFNLNDYTFEHITKCGINKTKYMYTKSRCSIIENATVFVDNDVPCLVCAFLRFVRFEIRDAFKSATDGYSDVIECIVFCVRYENDKPKLYIIHIMYYLLFYTN